MLSFFDVLFSIHQSENIHNYYITIKQSKKKKKNTPNGSNVIGNHFVLNFSILATRWFFLIVIFQLLYDNIFGKKLVNLTQVCH